VIPGGAGLRPPNEAIAVRVRSNELLTDGPFAETKEQIGGFSTIDCDDLEDAPEIAQHPPARRRGSRNCMDGERPPGLACCESRAASPWLVIWRKVA
jgi:hypothetical protein